jgi:hypothetical protein
VAAGRLDPEKIWPEYFRDPRKLIVPTTFDSDLDGFTWEPPTPESFEHDLQAIMAAAGQVSLRESPDPVMQAPLEPVTASELEWT